MKKSFKTKKFSKDPMTQVLKQVLEIKNMPLLQLAGEILARAQLIEELMRAYVVNNSTKYSDPRQVRGTFGQLKVKFKEIYPKEKELLEILDYANDVRNDIAHSSFLIGWFIEDLLKGHKKADIDRFNHRTLEKMFNVVDACVFEFIKFMKRVPLKDYDAKIYRIQPDRR